MSPRALGHTDFGHVIDLSDSGLAHHASGTADDRCPVVGSVMNETALTWVGNDGAGQPVLAFGGTVVVEPDRHRTRRPAGMGRRTGEFGYCV